jgi:ubiquitin-conjugating enzyme E2 G1
MAIKRLQSEYKQYLKDPSCHYTILPNGNNFLEWDILLFGPSDTIFEGGIFKCKIEFTNQYPNKPPVLTFITPLYHPNIFPNGGVCMSILHEGVDVYGYEHVSERWNPSHSVDSILMSMLLVLTEPNFDSPANIDASKLWRSDFMEYKKIIYSIIAKN